jgi:hypothetical protein
MDNMLAIFESKDHLVRLKVEVKDETVWLSQ